MPLVTFTPFVAGAQVTSSSINLAFTTLFNLFGQSGGSGNLDSANFGIGGINASQVVCNNFLKSGGITLAGALSVNRALVVGGSNSVLDSRILVTNNGATGNGGTLIFTGSNTFATLDFNIATANTYTIVARNTALPAYLRSYIPAFSAYGSLPAAITPGGTTESTGFHCVYGTTAVSYLGPTTVTLLNAAVFTGAGTYQVFVLNAGSNISFSVMSINNISGSQFQISTSTSSTCTWIAVGN
jgi:hypothetical protein